MVAVFLCTRVYLPPVCVTSAIVILGMKPGCCKIVIDLKLTIVLNLYCDDYVHRVVAVFDAVAGFVSSFRTHVAI